MEREVIEGWGKPVKLGFEGSVYELSPGDRQTFELKNHE
jgi:hypothetical protein